MKIHEIYNSNGRFDLRPAEEINCNCGEPVQFQREGYNDANFWNVVFKQPHVSVCQCGREHAIQWTPKGIKHFT